MGNKNLTIAAHYPQINGQTERCNNALVSIIRHYVADSQADWHEYVQPLIYASTFK